MKILDFGLAKLTQAPDGEGDEQPTATATDAGAWVGTPGYVSPEQLRGGRADVGSDVFALGAVLYEMLTGQRAFRGASRADTLSAILDRDPPPMTVPGGPLPASLERLVRRCLEKDPDDRFQSARDVGFALEALRGSPLTEELAVETGRAPRRSWLQLVAILASIVAAAAAGGLLVGRRVWQKPVPSFKQLTFRRGWIAYGRFAPDGRTVLYAAAWDGKPLEIFSTRTDTAESRPLGLRFSRVLSVSSTGQAAILVNPDREPIVTGTLAVVPIGGGAPRELLEDVQDADWTPDGRDLCILRWVGDEARIELPPGTVVYRTHNEVRFVRMSPTGHDVAFIEEPDSGLSVVVLDLATKRSRALATRIPQNMFGLAWAPKVDEVWFTAGHTIGSRDILAVDLSGRQRLVYRSAGVLSLLDISPDGRLLLHRSTDRLGFMARGPDDNMERDLSISNYSFLGGLSRDGRTLLVDDSGEPAGPSGAAYLRRLDGGDPVRLAEGAAALDLAPDERSVLVGVDGPPGLSEVPVGPGLPRPLDVGVVAPTWLARWVPPNADRVVFVGHETGHPDRLWVVGRSGGPPRAITAESSTGVFAVSPDGRKVAISLTPRSISIVPVEGGEAHEIHDLPKDLAVVRWSGDGRSIYLVRDNTSMGELYRLDVATERVALWREVAPADPTGIILCNYILPSDDGRSYAYAYMRSLTDIIVAEGLK